MRNVTVWLRCQNCGHEWSCTAVKLREEWGIEIYPNDSDCPDCGGTGEIIDVEDSRIAAANNFCSHMVEERQVGLGGYDVNS